MGCHIDMRDIPLLISPHIMRSDIQRSTLSSVSQANVVNKLKPISN